MPIHLRAEPGDYAPNVLCPGDPLRAQYIAETFFDTGFRQVNAERGMLGFSGTFEGSPISVQSTGMGCPSAGIVFEELIMLGATRLVRVGTCGGLRDGLAMCGGMSMRESLILILMPRLMRSCIWRGRMWLGGDGRRHRGVVSWRVDERERGCCVRVWRL